MISLPFYIRQVKNKRRREIRQIRRSIKDAKLWYVDIPRTSSTSIKTELSDKFGPIYGKYYSRENQQIKNQKTIKDHTPALEIKKLIGSSAWNDTYSFSFVRNPWDRFLSLYRFRIANNDLNTSTSFEAYVRGLESPRYNDKQSPFINKPYHMQMIDYLTNRNGKIIVDDVFKFEDRNTAINSINKNQNLNIGQLHIERTSTSNNYQDAYSPESKQIVAKFYATDIDAFGYEF